MTTFNAILQSVNHGMPILITAGLIILVAIGYFGRKPLRYIRLVANANTPDGEIKLAKLLAKDAGGANIDVNKSWPSFLGAAQEIHQMHQEKVEKLDNK
jgi:hypothetical protein